MTDTSDERLARIEEALHAVFAAEVATEIMEAVDFEALLAAEPAADAIDVDRLAHALGRPAGRALADRVVDGESATAAAVRTIGAEVGGQVAAKTVRTAVETVDVDDVVETVVEFDEELVTDRGVEILFSDDAEHPRVDDADAYELPEDADAGSDASGVHDAAGDDDAGVLEDEDAVEGDVSQPDEADGDASQDSGADEDASQERDFDGDVRDDRDSESDDDPV